MLILQRDIINI